MISPSRAVRTALCWMTVLPVGTDTDPDETPDRALGGAVMAALPVVGIVVGAAAAALAAGLSFTALPATLTGILVVVLTSALTRGMHLDGLADTADGLGCYGPPERVAEVMRSGTVGPFGVATLVLTLGLQTAGFTGLVGESRWYEIAFAVALGRLGAVVGTRTSISPAHPNGFGALVAGTQRLSIPVWCLVAAVATIPIGLRDNGSGIDLDLVAVVQGLVVVLVIVVFAWVFTRHCARRMGGLNGDVLGATIELGVALAVVGLLV
ncbi:MULTISPECIES: adenosylcobinamide-GDP ribazoletransferase [Gordonia]|uniref:adenosylcobinamide-GDP ribazoletransferase n=1 Tax=Gordonia TaxID=2053 RepID=UPI0002A65501|nr:MULTISPECIES: adenosylcobinamide-GDP ribazoletransferase [Gordonia]MBA5849509.1 adenosylcobinamide-GDP ribazoletransferase [Gordonia amicalis]MCZ0913745.1 adenosylcobinamide-GDP ribazoletransferase [Gordonia amicalis]MDJ0452272.1 adenosylcobinamide-GDP ribazoletransferase [Gordonia amicalis]MDV7074884.1 adenosylcobinamide-GDP ribazoletransferase [Gordonia amicalis]MDV7172011.1 adenosylcobinamide-GDP ribazoletransferase [Gordonia amicalis]